MKKALPIIGIVLFIGLVLWAVIAWNMYQYKECKKVGHETFYCFMRLGK